MSSPGGPLTLGNLRDSIVTSGLSDFYAGDFSSFRTTMSLDRGVYETLAARRLLHNSITPKKDDMSALDSAKIRFLHQKILERFEESPNSADEELLQLLDFNLPNAISTYQALGRSEHPIFTRDSWLSEAAAKMTDDGYATWLNRKITDQKVYSYSGDVVRLRNLVNPTLSTEPTWPYEGVPAPQAPQIPAAPPFAVRGFDRGMQGIPAPHPGDLWAATNVNEARPRNDQPEE